MRKKIELNKLYSFVKVVIFFSILTILIWAATNVTERKESYKKYADFMELSKQIDVLFLGSSHVYDGINPMQLYAEYGITSYNMAKHGGMVTESYWALMNALDYCKPKCVVVDLWALDRDYQYVDTQDGENRIVDGNKAVSFLHDNMDFWPLSKTKMASINDLIQSTDIKKEFLWDFIVYHDRWDSLEVNDFKIFNGKGTVESNLGANLIYMVEPKLGTYKEVSEGILEKETVSMQYLYKILDECEAREIEVILTFLPMVESYHQDWQAVNTATKIAEERDVLFINMLPHDVQNIINYKTDMFDPTHANTFGMRKITSYLGRYISEVEGIIDHRGDNEYQAWADKVSHWQGDEIQKLLNEDNLYLELGQICNLNANAIVFMKGNSQALHDPLIQEFVMQLSGSPNILEAAKCNGPYLLIREATSGEMQIQEFVGEQQVESFESVFGDTHYIGMKDFSAIYVDGSMEYNYLDMEEHYTSEVQISILGQEGEIMSQLFYDPNWNYMEIGESYKN